MRFGAAFTQETVEVWCTRFEMPAFTNFDGHTHFCQYCGTTDHRSLAEHDAAAAEPHNSDPVSTDRPARSDAPIFDNAEALGVVPTREHAAPGTHVARADDVITEITEVYEGDLRIGRITHDVRAGREMWIADAHPDRGDDDEMFGDVKNCGSDDEARTYLRRWHGLEVA